MSFVTIGPSEICCMVIVTVTFQMAAITQSKFYSLYTFVVNFAIVSD